MRSTVLEVRDQLRAAVAAFDPEVQTQASAAQLVRHFADIEKLAATGKALAARRVATGDGWRHTGNRTPAEWLARTTGTTTGAAAATLATADKLKTLPDIDAAARRGDLSPAQTEHLAAAATADPSAQAELVAAARTDTLTQLKERCARIRAAATDHQSRHAQLHRTRHLRAWSDPDGAAHIKIKTTPERSAELHALLAPHLAPVFTDARRHGQREPHDAYAHDALFQLIRHTDTTPAEDDSGTASAADGVTPGSGRPDPTVEARGAPPPAPRPVGPRAKIIVVIDHTALLRGHTTPGETCEIPGVGPVPVTVARSLAADAFFAAVIRRGTDIVNVAHLGRTVTAEQRTALELRDPRCVVPGCDTSHNLEIDHTTSATGWADTRRTTLDELARLCRHHHHQKTYDGYQLQGTPGHWHWQPPAPRHESAA